MAKGSITFFADETALTAQTSAQSYGAVSGSVQTKYRVTSLFGTTDAMARAITGGKVLLLKQPNSTKVNLFIKPNAQQRGFPSIKYFIYRGLKRSDFFNGAAITPNNPSDFITKVKKGQNPLTAINESDSEASDTLVEELFTKNYNSYEEVKQGESLGNFDGSGEYGIEIMLNEPGATMPLSIGRSVKNEIDVSSSPPESIKLDRLEILNYMDPAAFFGLYCRKGLSVGKGSNPSSQALSGSGVYSSLVSTFATGSKVYLDIRGEHNLPMDFFSSNNMDEIKVTSDDSQASTATFSLYSGLSNWPIVEVAGASFSNHATNDSFNHYSLRISLPKGNIGATSTPVIHLATGQWKSIFPSQKYNQINVKRLEFDTAPQEQWTKDIKLAVYATWTSQAVVSNYFRINYFSITDDEQLDEQIIDLRPEKIAVSALGSSIPATGAKAPDLSLISNTSIKSGLRVAATPLPTFIKDRVFLMNSGAATDEYGQTHFLYKHQSHFLTADKLDFTQKIGRKGKTKLDPNNDSHHDFVKSRNESLLSIKDDQSKESCFFDLISKEYPQTRYRGDNKKHYPLKLRSIELSTSPVKKALELRHLDLDVIKGRDMGGLDPFVSISFSMGEKTTIDTALNDTTKFASSPFRFFDDNGTMAMVSGGTNNRDYLSFRLYIKGILYDTTQSKYVWHLEDTGIDVYSFNGANFFSSAYATAFNTGQSDKLWDLSITTDLQQFSNASNQNFQASLQATMQTHLDAVKTIDKNLLLGEIRDHIYEADLSQLTFHLCFRLPFFSHKPHFKKTERFGSSGTLYKTYYVDEYLFEDIDLDGTTVQNQPYHAHFATWLANANALRALQTAPVLTALENSGLSNQLGHKDLKLYKVLDITRHPEFDTQDVPAFIARNFEDENPKLKDDGTLKYKSHAHFPANINGVNAIPTPDEYTVTQLDDLEDEVISTNLKSGLTDLKNNHQSSFGYAIIDKSKGANSTDDYMVNGVKKEYEGSRFIIKKAGETKFLIYPITSVQNNSGLTVGLGLDLGQHSSLKVFKDYTPYNHADPQKKLSTPLASTIKKVVGNSVTSVTKESIVEMAMGKNKWEDHEFEAAAIYCAFKDPVWNAITIQYNEAIEYALKIIKTSIYFKAGLGFLYTYSSIPAQFKKLTVYTSSGNLFFWDNNAPQFMNEVEKMLFAAFSYNSGNGYLQVGKPSTSSSHWISQNARRFVHAINTHDLRVLKEVNQTSVIARKDKFSKLLKTKNVWMHYADRTDEL